MTRPTAPKTAGELTAAVVDGAELLDQVLSALRRYVVMPSDEAAAAVVLWMAATHGMPAWNLTWLKLGDSADEVVFG